MNKQQPRFSVVIPAFNEEDYLGATIESLLQQDYTGSFEIVVVDNNSTDTTAVLANSYGVKVVQEKHPGVCWARQRGTEVASGEIVISTDADTTFSKNWLSTIDKGFEQDGVVAVAGPCKFVDPPYWGSCLSKSLVRGRQWLIETNWQPRLYYGYQYRFQEVGVGRL